ncbi:MAG: hypothetical protein HC874_23595 [Richelia sp. SL_2_1]|nr:hypothetical protein [Richelia sp. SL_2_1]
MITKEDIEKASRDKLREYAKQLEIKGYYRKTKVELTAIILEKINISEVSEDEGINPAVKWAAQVLQMGEIEDIEKACEELTEKLKLNEMMPKSRKNKTRPYTNPFKSLKPTSETEQLFYQYQAEGKATPVFRHIVFRLLGLDDYVTENEKLRESRKQKTTTSQQIVDVFDEEDKVFSVERYISTLRTLINSSDIWELATGLIAASGRRPIEILHTGNFELIEKSPNYLVNPEYAVRFTGQAKKQGEKPVMFISLLIPTIEFIEAFKKFRTSKEYTELNNLAVNLEKSQYSYQEINKKIDAKYGNKLRRIVEDYYDFMPKIDEDNAKNISLRASYSKLVTLRDMGDKNSKSQLRYTGYMLGHLTPIIHEDGSYRHDTKKEQRLSSTLLYGDYEPDTTNIPFLKNIINFQTETIKQTEVEDMVIIAELKAKIELLEKQLADKDEELKVFKSKLEYRKLDLPDVEVMDNQMLFRSRKTGSGEEKLNRVWEAITAFNDNATEFKINPTNPILRQLTGVNGQVVKKWIDEHKVMYDDHINKHGFDSYYNNRYRNKTDMNVDTIIATIEKDY